MRGCIHRYGRILSILTLLAALFLLLILLTGNPSKIITRSRKGAEQRISRVFYSHLHLRLSYVIGCIVWQASYVWFQSSAGILPGIWDPVVSPCPRIAQVLFILLPHRRRNYLLQHLLDGCGLANTVSQLPHAIYGKLRISNSESHWLQDTLLQSNMQCSKRSASG